MTIVYLSDIERGNKWPYLDTLVKLAKAFKVEVYELLKPENALPPDAAAILAEFTEDAVDVLEKSLEMAGKQVSQSLIGMRNQYLRKKGVSELSVPHSPSQLDNSGIPVLS